MFCNKPRMFEVNTAGFIAWSIRLCVREPKAGVTHNENWWKRDMQNKKKHVAEVCSFFAYFTNGIWATVIYIYMYVELLYKTNWAIKAGLSDRRDWQIPLSSDRLLNLFVYRYNILSVQSCRATDTSKEFPYTKMFPIKSWWKLIWFHSSARRWRPKPRRHARRKRTWKQSNQSSITKFIYTLPYWR